MRLACCVFTLTGWHGGVHEGSSHWREHIQRAHYTGRSYGKSSVTGLCRFWLNRYYKIMRFHQLSWWNQGRGFERKHFVRASTSHPHSITVSLETYPPPLHSFVLDIERDISGIYRGFFVGIFHHNQVLCGCVPTAVHCVRLRNRDLLVYVGNRDLLMYVGSGDLLWRLYGVIRRNVRSTSCSIPCKKSGLVDLKDLPIKQSFTSWYQHAYSPYCFPYLS